MSQLEITSKLVTQASLADYTDLSLVVPDLQPTDTAGIIADLSHRLQRHGCISDVLSLYHAALNKELMECSAQECGIAFPHARLSAIKNLQFALGRTARPVQWGGRGAAQVRLVFLLAVPATDAANYLHLLASIARLGQRQDVIEHLIAAPTPSALLSQLATIPIRQ
jgi:mannitol/fructose-specific phosphotransferase system IIA component (Ntr-type)